MNGHLEYGIDKDHLIPIFIAYVVDTPYHHAVFTGIGICRKWWKFGLDHLFYDGCHHNLHLGPICIFWESPQCDKGLL